MTGEETKMDICGIWKIKEISVPTPEGVKTYSRDNMPEGEMYEDFKQMIDSLTEFVADGTLNTLFPVPEEMKEKAANLGAVVRDDGYAVVESTTWKEQDGRFYYDTKIEGEVLGEKVDSFTEIPVTADGCLRYGLGMILLERV